MAWYERDYNRAGGYGGVGFGGAVRGQLAGAPVTLWLIIINFIVLVINAILTGSSRGDALSPRHWGNFNINDAISHLQLWRWVTYQFLHAGFFHLAFNMIALYFFGPLLEAWWGHRRYLAFFLICGSCGAFFYTLLAFVPDLLRVDPNTPLMGASGSLFGILVGCAVLYPRHRVMLLFPPIPMTMRTLAMIILGIATFSLLAGSPNAGGEAAHLGGGILGFVLIKNPRFLGFAERIGTGWFKQVPLRRSQHKAQQQRHFTDSEQAKVDLILDKVREHGMHSLTNREKRTLKHATDRRRHVG